MFIPELYFEVQYQINKTDLFGTNKFCDFVFLFTNANETFKKMSVF